MNATDIKSLIFSTCPLEVLRESLSIKTIKYCTFKSSLSVKYKNVERQYSLLQAKSNNFIKGTNSKPSDTRDQMQMLARHNRVTGVSTANTSANPKTTLSKCANKR